MPASQPQNGPSSTVEDYLMEIYDMGRAGQTVIAARLTEKMGVTSDA